MSQDNSDALLLPALLPAFLSFRTPPPITYILQASTCAYFVTYSRTVHADPGPVQGTCSANPQHEISIVDWRNTVATASL